MSAWFQTFASTPNPLARVFCFPHAGGAPAAFRLWPQGMPREVELVAIQLPGRGGRLREPPITSIPLLTEQIASAIEPLLDRPYVLFGHSMGAVLAHEVARATVGAGRRAPDHLFLSARRPPHWPRVEADLHPLPDDAFLQVVGKRYGGIPAELLRERELLDLLLPSLRADITALETFVNPDASAEPMSCALTVFGGDEDRLISLEQLRAWHTYTSGEFRLRQFRGGHFYLNEARAAVVAAVAEALLPLISRTAAGVGAQ